jgi:hypothetical protein
MTAVHKLTSEVKVSLQNPMLDELANHRGFVVYKLEKLPSGKTNKVPIDVVTGRNSDAQDSRTWLLPHEAEAGAAKWASTYTDGSGVGIVIYENSGLFCIDLDGCMDAAGNVSPVAAEIITRFPGAPVEISQSDTGLHILAGHDRTIGPHKTKNTAHSIEMYTGSRFIALTGNVLIPGRILTDHSAALAKLAAEYFPKDAETGNLDWKEGPAPDWNFITDDAQLIAWGREHKSPAQQLGGRCPFPALMDRDVDVLAKFYPPNPSSTTPYDASSVDQAAANHLAWLTGNDCERVLRIMQSDACKLTRDKWESRPGYLRGTIANACSKPKKWPKIKGATKVVGDRVQSVAPPSMPTPPPPEHMPAPDDPDLNMQALHPTVYAEIKGATDDTLFLGNDHLPHIVAAQRIFERLGATRELFRRGDAVVEVGDKGRITVVTPTMLQSRLNERGRKVRSFGVNDKTKELFHHPKACGESAAKVMLNARAVTALPEIKLVTRMPLLLERDGQLVVTQPGYNADCGVLVTGDVRVLTVPLAEAAAALEGLLHDFKFAEAADKARALASMVAPALRMARMVKGDALIAAGEADASQTGKGYLFKTIRAPYGEATRLLTQRTGGVGSFDESLSQELLEGSPFVTFDNLRGVLNSTLLEMVITAGDDPVPVRVPHRAAVPIDASRTTFQLTSNGVQGTVDLSNRLLLIRLRKQPKGYRFKSFAEGDLLAHIEARAAYYLGCVHAVVRHWHGAGKPELESDHSFRHWVGALDWLTQSVWKTRPLLEGHESALSRIADPGKSWLRKLALLVIQAGKGGQELPIETLRELCRDHDELPPHMRPDADDLSANMAMGRVLRRCFAEGNELTLDGIRITRIEREERNEFRTLATVRSYMFHAV